MLIKRVTSLFFLRKKKDTESIYYITLTLFWQFKKKFEREQSVMGKAYSLFFFFGPLIHAPNERHPSDVTSAI